MTSTENDSARDFSPAIMKETEKYLLVMTKDQLAVWLQDRTFVDYFNVFLSLPVFPQRLIYKFDEREFDFDPAVPKTKLNVNREKLVEWLLKERVPYFLKTALFVEYSLSKVLQGVKPILSQSTHRLDFDDHRQVEDYNFLIDQIGHVIGMARLRQYLAGTAGATVLQFWMDIESFFHLPLKEVKGRWTMFREIQLKYFKARSLAAIKEPVADWEMLSDSGGLLQQPFDLRSKTAPSSSTPVDPRLIVDKLVDELVDPPAVQEIDPGRLREIQSLLLAVLKDYWLQKFLIHEKMYQLKKDRGSQAVLYKIQSKSDLAILKDVKNIDKALCLLQGRLKRGQHITKAHARFSWSAMFPDHVIDDSFINANDEVVTLHNDGTVSVCRPKSEEFELMLHKYFSDTSDSDDQGPTTTTTTSSSSTSTSCTNSSTNILRKLRQRPLVSAHDKKTEEEATEAQLARNTHSNLALFEQLLDLNFETIPRDSTSNEELVPAPPSSSERPQSCLPDALNDPSLQPTGKATRHTRSQHSKNMQHEQDPSGTTLRSITEEGHLPPIHEDMYTNMRETESKDKLDKCYANPNPGASIQLDVMRNKNMRKGCYRYDNRKYVCAVAMDAMAGSRFGHFLCRRRMTCALTGLRFWHDSQVYMCTTLIQQNNIANYIKFRRAKLLMLQYLERTGEENVGCLPPGLRLMLLRLLPEGKGTDLLQDAQDIVARSLRGPWKSYQKHEKVRFRDVTVARCRPLDTSGRQGSPRAGSLHTYFRRQNRPTTQVAQSGPQRDEEESNETLVDGKHDKVEEASKDKPSEGELAFSKRLNMACQFTLNVNDMYHQSLLLDRLALDELEFDLDQPYGSLAARPMALVRKSDFLLELERIRIEFAKARAAREKELEQRRLAMRKTVIQLVDDGFPFFMKCFRKNGHMQQRPPKPKNFSDILRCPVHLEFFRRFLMWHEAETPLMFYIAVEEIKKCRDNKVRQQKISQILRRYFKGTSGKGIEALECPADVIREIPSLERVTTAVLVSAQACVMRSMEAKWFSDYQDTFPDNKDADSEEALATDSTDAKRKWTKKQRTLVLWQTFVRSVICFQRCIMDPKAVKGFEQFLRLECQREIEKQKATSGQGHVPGVPIKKMIKNKLVDVTKLVNDLHFVTEVNRFCAICYTVSLDASEGNYSADDQRSLDSKAKMVVDCFIDSDLPPRVQINISQEIAETIEDTFSSHIIERSLFHEATIAIFPVIAYLWKTYRKLSCAIKVPSKDIECTPNKRGKGAAKSRTPQTGVRKKLSAPTTTRLVPISQSPAIPDYMYIGVPKSKKIVTHKEDDQPRLLFSLHHGARLYVPFTAPIWHRRDEPSLFFPPGGDSMHNFAEGGMESRFSFATQEPQDPGAGTSTAASVNKMRPYNMGARTRRMSVTVQQAAVTLPPLGVGDEASKASGRSMLARTSQEHVGASGHGHGQHPASARMGYPAAAGTKGLGPHAETGQEEQEQHGAPPPPPPPPPRNQSLAQGRKNQVTFPQITISS